MRQKKGIDIIAHEICVFTQFKIGHYLSHLSLHVSKGQEISGTMAFFASYVNANPSKYLSHR